MENTVPSGHPVEVHPEKCSGCRSCQLKCSFEYLGEFNPLKAYIVITRSNGMKTTSIRFTDDCLWCGNCTEVCAYGAIKLS